MPRIKMYSHLIKPLVVKDGPPGLYAEPRVWAEGRDWEGFAGHFSYGFFKEPAVCHPLEGAVTHPYDEVLVFAGTDTSDVLRLGGEMSIEIGEEREEHVFTESTVISIPKGTPHGPATIRRLDDKPIAHFLIGLDPEYKAEKIPEKSRPAKTKGSKHSQLIKLLRTYVPDEKRAATSHVLEDTRGRSKTGMGYESMMDERGVMHPRDRMGPGNADQLVWLFGEDIQSFKLNFTWGFWSAAGKWHRPGEGHLHPEEEALIFVGLDPDRPDYLGAEIEFAMGKEFERHVFRTPTAVIAPKGFIHLPCITRWCDSPYSFIVACLGDVHEAPWLSEEDLKEMDD
jgi:hypothetical protein